MQGSYVNTQLLEIPACPSYPLPPVVVGPSCKRWEVASLGEEVAFGQGGMSNSLLLKNILEN